MRNRVEDQRNSQRGRRRDHVTPYEIERISARNGTLGVGDRPDEVAREFDLSPSGISKMRERMRRSWKRFEGEEGVAAGAAVAMA